MSAEEQEAANEQFDQGVMTYKGILADDQKHLEKTYGALLTQMHPEDVAPQLGSEFNLAIHSLQDMQQLVASGSQYFDYKKEEDKKFRDLTDYYTSVNELLLTSSQKATIGISHVDEAFREHNQISVDPELEASINGPQMTQLQQARYKKELKKRNKEGYIINGLFGRFK